MPNEKIIKVANGLVKGQVENVLGKDIVRFLSIPYCKPPIHERRFKKAQPCDTFSNEIINKMSFETCPPFVLPFINDSTIFSNLNEEWMSFFPKEKQDEDCLYVNIWCPLSILEGNEKRPVLTNIYGGGFVCGSSSLDIQQGDVLASHEDIVVVSFNYRVGALGFLCLDEMELIGNLGIWDQVLALKWIHDNISVFNGDPENITISGCSAGGFSVTLHLLIEESWPNFNKAISQSGVCLCEWGLQTKEESVRRSVETINKVLDKFQFPLRYDPNLPKQDKQSIIDFIQTVDFKEFLIDSEIVNGFFQLAWSPYLDGELLKSHPRILLKEDKFKKCPTIILTSENEASLCISFLALQREADDSEMVDIKYFHNFLEYYPHFPIKCKESTKDKIKKEYNILNKNLSIHVLDKIVSDQQFNCASIEFAIAISKSNKEVYYIWHRNFIHLSIFGEVRGATHGSEMPFLFGIPLRYPHYESYVQTSKDTMARFGNFIKTGHFDRILPHFDDFSKSIINVVGTDWHEGHFEDDQINKIRFWKDLEKD